MVLEDCVEGILGWPIFLEQTIGLMDFFEEEMAGCLNSLLESLISYHLYTQFFGLVEMN